MQISHARSGARILGLALAALAIAVPAAQAGKPAKAKSKEQHVQLLAINDLHGHIAKDTPGTIQVGCCNEVTNAVTGAKSWAQKTVPAGGVAYLATHMKNLQAHRRYTIEVGAGDMIGASPLASALFHDEPTIEALNASGMDLVGVGNHEFDEGIDELQRMQYGNQRGGDGCHPVDGCQDGTPFRGAFFKYLAANVFYAGTDETIFPPYKIRNVRGTKIAFIGLTFEGTPTVVTPSGVAGLEFRPEVTTTNTLVTKLKKQGVKAFVVLLHQGGSQRPPSQPAYPAPVNPDAYTDVNKCVSFNGPEMQAIATGLDPSVGVIVSAHTHQPYVCQMAGKLVTSAASFGRLITDIDLTIDRKTDTIKAASATNRIVTQDVDPDPEAQAIVDKYTTLSAPLANRVIGRITADIIAARDDATVRTRAGEQPMGDVIADAMYAATSPTDFGGAQAAFMNAGGVRASLRYAPSLNGGEGPGEVTYGEAFNVQPFGNTLVVKSCTGQQIYDVLNQQFDNPSVGSNTIMLPSSNVKYTWTDAVGSPPNRVPPHVVDGSVTFNGAAISKSATYRVAMNNFMADGGDGYSVFRSCTNALGGEVDLDAFARYLQANSPVPPPTMDRISRTP